MGGQFTGKALKELGKGCHKFLRDFYGKVYKIYDLYKMHRDQDLGLMLGSIAE